jgi:hypothetical protein
MGTFSENQFKMFEYRSLVVIEVGLKFGEIKII